MGNRKSRKLRNVTGSAFVAVAAVTLSSVSCGESGENREEPVLADQPTEHEQSVQRRVSEVVAEILGAKVKPVLPGDRFVEDLGADSLDAVEIVMALEEEFDLAIPDAEAVKMVRVGDATSFIERKLADTRRER